MIGIMTTTDDSKQAIGKLNLYDEAQLVYDCVTLELPWKDNKRNESCIPAGEYLVKLRYSEKYGNHLIVMGVKDRDYILIHAG